MEQKKKNKELPFYHVGILVAVFAVQCGKQTTTVVQSLPTASLIFSEPFAYDFGKVIVGESKFITITVTNNGEEPATELTSSFVTAAFVYQNGYPGTGGDCGEQLNPGESCQIVITFSPPLATDYLELLRLSYFNGVETVTTKKPTLEGEGITSP